MSTAWDLPWLVEPGTAKWWERSDFDDPTPAPPWDRTAGEVAAALPYEQRVVLDLLADHRAFTCGQLAALRGIGADAIASVMPGMVDAALVRWLRTGVVLIRDDWGDRVADHLPGRPAGLPRSEAARDTGYAVLHGEKHARLRTNAIVTALAAREHGDGRLVAWWAPDRFRGWLRHEAAPWEYRPVWRGDAYVVWEERGRRFGFTLVAEPPQRRDKALPWSPVSTRAGAACRGCHHLGWVVARPEWLLVACESRWSEDEARRTLAKSLCPGPFATALLAELPDPAGPLWRPFDCDNRVRLAELADVTMPPTWTVARADAEERRRWQWQTASELAGDPPPDLLHPDGPRPLAAHLLPAYPRLGGDCGSLRGASATSVPPLPQVSAAPGGAGRR